MLENLLSKFRKKEEGELNELTALALNLQKSYKVRSYWMDDLPLKEHDAGQAVLNLSNEDKCMFVMAMLSFVFGKGEKEGVVYKCAMKTLFKRKLPFNSEQLTLLFQWLNNSVDKSSYMFPFSGVVKALENYSIDNEIPAELDNEATILMGNLLNYEYSDANDRKLSIRIEKALGKAPSLPIKPGEAWANATIEKILTFSNEEQSNWIELINHCMTASGSKPSAKWNKQAQESLSKIGEEKFVECIKEWLPKIDLPRPVYIEPSMYGPDLNNTLLEEHADIVKGLVWTSGLINSAEVARLMGALAQISYKKVPGIGPKFVKIGNACIYALGSIPSMDAVGQLALLKVKVKFIPAQKGIEKSLNAAAEREKLPRDEIEEMAVPTYGLENVGETKEQLGDFKAVIRVKGTATVDLFWEKEDGKEQKSVPAKVKSDFPEEIKEIKLAIKDIQKMIPAQRERIESLYLEKKEWEYSKWVERYLSHPLVGILARKIIWNFEISDNSSITGMYLNEDLCDVKGNKIEGLSDNTKVKLWHPIDVDVSEVLAWRNFLMENEIQQPFKQAHREVYILTDAEINTNVYSNRYASHILKQHQFNALCGAKGWKNTLRLMVDDEYPPAHKLLTKYGLRAEFWIEGIGDDYGTDTTEAGSYLYLSTDQVRFYKIDADQKTAHAGGGGYSSWREQVDEPINLSEIDKLVFSEIMRDVDLFVGVSSVGNDPAWADGGTEDRRRDYWHSYSFGDLSTTAKTRKELLENVVPKLNIGSQCSFTDKFLIVKGDVRTYKIHFGSGNILMEPNDQYLCIVPKSSMEKNATKKVFLPFEGDRMVSIILSKAMLLADDKKITDETILSQINS